MNEKRNYKSRNSYKSRNNGGRGRQRGTQEQPRPAYREEPNEAFLNDCTNAAQREIWDTFSDCAARAFKGEEVNFAWELAKVTARALAAMAALEGYPLNEEVAGEGAALCFDGYRDSFEIEAAAALAEWNAHILPALARLAAFDIARLAGY